MAFFTTVGLRADSSRQINTVEELSKLTNDPANVGITVRLKAVVLQFNPKVHQFFVRDRAGADSPGAVYVAPNFGWDKLPVTFSAGDQVEIVGVTARGGYSLDLAAEKIGLVARGPAPPQPIPLRLDQVGGQAYNCQLVAVEGELVSVGGGSWGGKSDVVALVLKSGDQTLTARLAAQETPDMRNWLGSRVRVEGIAATLFNSKGQGHTPTMYLDSAAAVTLLGDTKKTKSPAPFVHLHTIFQQNHETPASVQTSGLVSFVNRLKGFYIQDETAGIFVRPAYPVELQPGDEVVVTGEPGWDTDHHAQISFAHVRKLERPRSTLTSDPWRIADTDIPFGEGRQVEVDGWVDYQGTSSLDWSLTLHLAPREGKDPYTVHAVLLKSVSEQPIARFEVGSQVRVRGVLEMDWQPSSYRPIEMRVLLRQTGDVRLIAPPPLVMRLPWIQIVAFAALILVAGSFWLLTLRKRVRQQTAQIGAALAQAEQANAAKSEFLAEIKRLNDQLEQENARMSSELEVTKRLQQMILPRDEDLSNVASLDISGFMEPAAEVGGDYYDVVARDGGVFFGIGDVTGHGLESGVMAIMVQTAVRTLLASGQYESKTFFDVLNRVIFGNARRMNCDRNLTLSLLHYQDSLVTISGQHEEVLVVRVNGDVERHDTLNLGFQLGLVEDISGLISEVRVPLQRGDVMVAYTDGITEAMNCDGVSFGIERLSEAVRTSHKQAAGAIREAVLSSLHKYIGGQHLLDDISLLVIKPA